MSGSGAARPPDASDLAGEPSGHPNRATEHPYLQFIREQVARTESDHAALRQRLTTLITTSATMITFLTAVGAIVFREGTDSGRLAVSPFLALLLSLGAIDIVIAAVLGVLGLSSAKVDAPAIGGLPDQSNWTASTNDNDYQQRVAESLVAYQAGLSCLCTLLARRLNLGVIMLVIGIGIVGLFGVVGLFVVAVG